MLGNRIEFASNGWPAALLVFTLAGCGPDLSRFPIADDYCAKEHRRIPDREKIEILINKIARTPKAEAYLSEYKNNPLCCQLIKPDYLSSEPIYPVDSYLQTDYEYDRDWGYVADFIIRHKPPYHDLQGEARSDQKGPQGQGLFKVSACADFRYFSRG